MSSSRESWWPELAAFGALMARDAAGVPAAAAAGRELLRQKQPAGRGGGREDHAAAAAAGKRAKVMHLLLWGPK